MVLLSLPATVTMARTKLLFLALLSTFLICRSIQDSSSPNVHNEEYLNLKLHKFHKLHLNEVKHFPFDGSLFGHKRQVHFSALGRFFRLYLQHHSIVKNGAILQLVNGKGEKRYERVPSNEFYKGVVIGETGSFVHAHIDDRGILTAQILLSNEEYRIEPSSLYIAESHAYHMIVYTGSDLRPSLDGIKAKCKQVHVEGDSIFHPYNSRELRQAGGGTTDLDGKSCAIHLVADYKYYQMVGRGSETRTLALMVGTISRVDNIYRNTMFEAQNPTESYKNIGLHVTNITIYKESSNVPAFNREGDVVVEKNPDDVLGELAESDWSHVCLAHLFTFQRFSQKILGIAYTAPKSRDNPGGICSDLRPAANDRQVSHNVGLSSSMDRESNQPVLQIESDIIASHEIGHNFGSSHDPVNGGECDPPRGLEQGKFIMHQAAVDGTEANNKRFSKCSRLSIGAVLRIRVAELNCFEEPAASLCGNKLVEEGEECDAGLVGDGCCSSSCLLLQQANCSYMNDACCTQSCGYAPSNQTCADESRGNLCLQASFCTGSSKDCPPQEPLTGGACLGMGTCVASTDPVTNERSGVCQPFCKTLGMEPCICSDGPNECKLCCRNTDSQTCQVYTNENETGGFNLNNGALCTSGFCTNGNCQIALADLNTRLFTLFNNFSINEINRFILENLVGCIILLSTIVWIGSLLIIQFVLVPLWNKKLHGQLGVELKKCCLCCGPGTAIDIPKSTGPDVPMTPAKRQFSRTWSKASSTPDHFYGPDIFNYSRSSQNALPVIIEESDPSSRPTSLVSIDEQDSYARGPLQQGVLTGGTGGGNEKLSEDLVELRQGLEASQSTSDAIEENEIKLTTLF